MKKLGQKDWLLKNILVYLQHMIYVTLEAGTEKELKEKIQNYLQQYPSAGYGTQTYPPYLELYNKWKVKIERSSSCD